MLSREFAHWHNYFEDLSVSTNDFYRVMEEGILTRQVPKTRANCINLSERGPLSAKRLYLQIRRDWMTYHICLAPFGTGFFVSSRLLVNPWRTWPVIFMLFVLGCGGLFALYSQAYLSAHSFLAATIMTMWAAIPGVFAFGLVLILWLSRCLHMTYYRRDTMMAFQEAVHRLLIATVNMTIEPSGRKPLTDEESKPILHKLLRR